MARGKRATKAQETEEVAPSTSTETTVETTYVAPTKQSLLVEYNSDMNSRLRGVLNALNALNHTSNDSVVSEFAHFLTERLNLDVSVVNGLVEEFNGQVRPLYTLSSKTKSKRQRNADGETTKKAPNRYNIFIKENMSRREAEQPDMKQTEFMAHLASNEWGHKEGVVDENGAFHYFETNMERVSGEHEGASQEELYRVLAQEWRDMRVSGASATPAPEKAKKGKSKRAKKATQEAVEASA